MSGRIRRKWRPPLALVLGGVLCVAVAAPIAAALFTAQTRDDANGLAAGLGVALGGLVLIAWVMRRAILGPVTELAARARDIGAGTPGAFESQRHYGTREIGDLGQNMLAMAQTLADREAAIRSYTDHVTHELKAPITAIRGAAELMESDGLSDADRARLIATVAASAERLDRLLGAARSLAAAREPRHIGVSRLDDVLPGLRARFPGLRIEATGSDQTLPLSGRGLDIVLGHLAGNAAQAGAGRLTLHATGGAAAGLSVADDGPGISPGNADRVFDPFFSTRRGAGGTGMGLAIVATLLGAHGGAIALEPGAGNGTRFQITFQACARPA